MKVIIFLCFALIASQHMVAAMSRAEILSLLQQGYNVDKVLQLLQALQGQESEDLSNLDAAYNENEPLLSAEIQRTAELVENKISACEVIEGQVAAGRDQEERLRANIQAAQETINSNIQKAEDAAEARCAANLLFLSELANKQEAVEFLNYLRGVVADPAFGDYIRDQSGAFIQIKAALASKKESEILTVLAKHHMLSVLQKKSKQDYEGESDLGSQLTAGVRSEDEIGTGYLDNNRGALEHTDIDTSTLSVDDYVQLLLQYIDQLIAQLNDSAEKLQEAETAAVQAFISYQNQLDDQNYVLQQYIAAATDSLNQLVAVDDANQLAGEQCRAEVVPLEAEAEAAVENRANYVQAYNVRRANLVDTVALLGQVIQVYQEEVVNVASDEYKARADDFLDNQVFDSTADFTARTDLGA